MEFEDALLVDNWDFLEDLVSKLLRGCYQRKDINIENFHMYLEDIIRHRWELEEGKENPLQGIHFRALSSRVIVEILHKLCDYRLDATDVFDLLKGLEADSLRVEPLGEDTIGARYWYFYGTRLYKELPQPTPPKETPKHKGSKNDNKKGKKLKEEGKMKNSKVLHKNITTKGKDEKQKKKWKLRYSLSKKSGKLEKVEKGSGILDETSDEETNVQKENDAAGYNVSPVKVHLEEWSTWSLVCHTLEEWQHLTDGFGESQCSKERKLYKILTENFIPEISNLIIQKEKQLQKKYAEIVPRRASDRLLVKRTQQEELFSSLLKQRQTVFGKLGEKRMKDGYYLAAQGLYTPQEIKHIEEEGKILARQERARRHQLREEKQMSYVRSTLKRKRNSKAHSLVKLEEVDKEKPEVHYRDDEEYVSMYKVLDAVKGHKDSWPFNEPVDESYAPGYHKIIEESMDLSTIENKLTEKKYSSKWDFESDFRLMFDNCEHYNGKGNEYTLMGQAVERCFDKAMAKYFPKDEVDSDDDFRAKMMWEKKDKHKSKPNYLAMDESEILTEGTEHVLGMEKVNGFMNSHSACDDSQMIADLKKEGDAEQQLCITLPLPSQMPTMEEKQNSTNGPQPSSEVIHQPQAPRVPGRTVMEPIRKRFQQQYRMQQQMLMNGTPASTESNSASLQTASLSSNGHGNASPHTDFDMHKSPQSRLDQISQRPPVKDSSQERAAYSNLFSMDQHHYLMSKEPASNKATPLSTSAAANLLQQDTTGKSAESDRLGGNAELNKEQKLFQSNAVGEKDSEDCYLSGGQNLVLSNNLTIGGKHGMKDPKSVENLRLTLANNAEAHSDLPNGSSETVGSIQQRNPAVFVARPDTRHQFGPVSAYMHYLGCNPENLASAHSFVQPPPHLMVVHPMQGQASHFYQHPTEQQISTHMNNLGYHPQQSIQSALMSDRGYLTGQPGLYSQSPFMFLREGTGQSQANPREQTDMYSEQRAPERDECKPLHEASVKKQKSEASERRVAASKIGSNVERASKHGREQDYLDLDGQTATKRQKVIHPVSAAYDTSQMTSGIYSHHIPLPALYANATSHNVQRLPYGQPYNPQLLRVRSVITSTSNHMVPHQVMNHGPFGMQLFSPSSVKPSPYPGTVIVQRPQFNTSGDLYMVRNLLPDYPVLKQMGRRDPDSMPQPQDKAAPTPCMNQP
ncbi:hypothetical protein scyTo_0014380 [Scyliorhinus torazame]|uniref:Bromo domain-containing protein n=1 Tax=Scyliorhinus torazame TaxID=75743 RepID=A0A401NLL9_SCYTO|nr:hypothetical protein [Scyliorhinus torazame]